MVSGAARGDAPAVLSLAAPAEQSAASGAVGFVESLGARTVEIIEQTGTDDQRHDALKRLVGDGFDLTQIGRFVLGRYWRESSAAQRIEFQDLFAEHLLTSYARHLDSYRPGSFSVAAGEPIGRNDIMVETRAENGDGPLDAGWRIRTVDGLHKVVDVVVKGISLALTRRQEFTAVAKKQGITGLLASLRQANAQPAPTSDKAGPGVSDKAWMMVSVLGSSETQMQVGLAKY
jgi:phospholipid transport system substrate-binding protein